MPLMIRPIPRIGSFLTYMIILFIYHKFITLVNKVHLKKSNDSYDVLKMFWALTCTLIHIF